MARLSIDDLNNLSGVNEESLNQLSTNYYAAHNRLFNRVNSWLNRYNDKLHGVLAIGTNEQKYKEARKLYYNASCLNIDINLFQEYTKEYQSLLSVLRRNDILSNVMKYLKALQKLQVDMNKDMDCCFLIYDTAYKDMNREEENYG